MKRLAWIPALLAAGACASLRPGPTRDGIAAAVKAREPAAARREAVESVLPLFLAPEERRERADAVAAALARPETLVGRERRTKDGAVVEVRVDALARALDRVGLLRRPGFPGGPQGLLIAFGPRGAPRPALAAAAADSFETAAFGRGIQARDADDPLVKLEPPIRARTQDELVAQAAKAGWPWLATGGAADEARPEPAASAWRGEVRLSVSLYSLVDSTAPLSIESSGAAVDVSSAAARSRALDAAAADAALRVESAMSRRRGGRATIAVLAAGRKDPAYLLRVVRDLRRVPGVANAALVSWRGLDEMAVLHAAATELPADRLAAELLRLDPSLRIDAIETEDNRLTLEGPPVPEDEDRGD